MRFCLILGWVLVAVAAEPGATAHRYRSVVKTDPRTGRLVRVVTSATQPAHSKKGSQAQAPLQADPAVQRFISNTAERYKVDPVLVDSVIQVESAYNPFAVSPKGATGMMQLMPGTARRLAVNNTLDPWQNIEGGVRYLRYLLNKFGEDDPRLALAAYNAGEGAVLKHGGVPPYPETTQYVEKVGRKMGEAHKAVSAAQAAAAPKPPEPPVIEEYVDSNGVLHLRTRSGP